MRGCRINLDDSSSSEELENGDDRESLDDNPGLDFDDHGSDWYHLRRRLWTLISYGTETDIFYRVCHMWQTNLEIKTFGWPVLPMEAFLKPDRYSTTEKHRG